MANRVPSAISASPRSSGARSERNLGSHVLAGGLERHEVLRTLEQHEVQPRLKRGALPEIETMPEQAHPGT